MMKTRTAAPIEPFAQALLDAIPDAILAVDQAGLIVLVNTQTELLLGYSRPELLGEPLERLLREGRCAQPQAYGNSDRQNNPHRARALNAGPAISARRRDGTWVPVEITRAPLRMAGRSYTLTVVRDLTERRGLADDLFYISTHDALTGLLNRCAFDQALSRLDEWGPHPIGVVMVDLDELKRVNDERGHAAGDTLLQGVARVLRATFRSDDVVARIGGDEFAVLAAGRDAGAVEVLGQRLVDEVERSNQLDDAPRLRLSIGVAIAESGVSVATALRDADECMYSMKRLHRDEQRALRP